MQLRHPLIVSALFLLASIGAFVGLSVHRNSSEIWFSNVDQDSVILIDVLRVNSGKYPDYQDHPSHGTYIAYAAALSLLEKCGLVPISRFDQLESYTDPLMLLPEVFYKARGVSIFLCVVCVIVFGCTIWLATHRLAPSVLAAFLLLFSPGLIFQSWLIRSELASGLCILLSVFFVALEYRGRGGKSEMICRFVAGLFMGMAVLSKVQALPALLVVPAFMYLGVRHKADAPRRTGWAVSAAVKVASYLFLAVFVRDLVLAYRQVHLSIPALAIALLCGIVVLDIVSHLPRLRGRVVFVFASKIPLLLVGFLAAFYVSFYFLNTYNYPTPRRLELFAGVFQKVLCPQDQANTFAGRMLSGVPAVMRALVMYVVGYVVGTGYIPIIVALGVLARVRKSPWASPLAATSLAAALLFCVFNSLRLFGPHYLIYTDMFFIGAIVFSLARTSPESRGVLTAAKAATYAGIVLIVMGLGVHSYRRLSDAYADWTIRKDRADLVYHLMTLWSVGTSDYEKLIAKRYGNPDNVTRRVCNDPHLNGADRGIDLRNKPNPKRFYPQYFDAYTGPPVTIRFTRDGSIANM